VADPTDIDVRRLRLEPGDILAIRLAKRPTGDQLERYDSAIRAMLIRAGHGEIPVLYLEPGASLEILTIDKQRKET